MEKLKRGTSKPRYRIVNEINPEIFRGYDIRGVMGRDLNTDVYYTLGRAYATFLSQRRIKDSTVGRDNRLNGDSYAKAFIQGLNDGGINTIDLGLSLSQIVYFSCYEFKIKGSAMITASHNPKEFNGLKLGVGYSDTMISEEIQQMRRLVEKGDFVSGLGKSIKRDIFPAYKADITRHFKLKKKWRVVVDTCNTTSGLFYPPVLRSAGCRVFAQNARLDGNFPLGVPDPTEVDVLDRLAVGVKKHGCDLGFAFDADGDRMAVVDDRGRVLWMDTIVALFVKDVLRSMPKAPIVYNNLCSRAVTETIEACGGIPVMWLTGHSFIKAKVKEARSPFGGELSGHIFFMDNFYGHDDGAYASLRLLQFLENEGKDLSEAVDELPSYVSSPEIKFKVADNIKLHFVNTKVREEFAKHWPKGKYVDIDGIRVDTESEMAIIRASQNGPYITVKFEAKTPEQYEKVKGKLKKILKKYPEVDWSSGVNTYALD